MKRFTALMVLLFVLAVGTMFAQDTTVVATSIYYADSLKTTHDTVDVYTGGMSGANYYSISAYTDSGTDTVIVYTKSPGDSYFVQKGLVDLSSNTDATQMVVSTTKKEFLVLTSSGGIRIYSPGTTSIITRFTVHGLK